MSIWRPKLKAPHPSTVFLSEANQRYQEEIEQFHQRTFSALKRKWEKEIREYSPVLTNFDGPSAVVNKEGLNRGHVNIGSSPPPLKSSLPFGTTTASAISANLSFKEKTSSIDSTSTRQVTPTTSRSGNNCCASFYENKVVRKQRKSGNIQFVNPPLKKSSAEKRTPKFEGGTPPDNRSIMDMFPIKRKRLVEEKDLSLNNHGSTKARYINVPKKKENATQISEMKNGTEELNEDAEGIHVTSLTSDTLESLGQKITDNPPLEICITILYREKFSQLSRPAQEAKTLRCSPYGLLVGLLDKNLPAAFYFLELDTRGSSRKQRSNSEKDFIQRLMTANCKKICFEAQEIFVYLIHTFDFKCSEVSLKWTFLDPLVGCWLLNPDYPPADFSDVLNMLELTRDKKHISRNVQIQTCSDLLLLSKVIEQMYHKLTNQNLWSVFLDMESQLVSVLAVMEERGIKVDKPKLEKMSKALEVQLSCLQADANRLVRAPVLLTSPLQLRRILFDHLKLDAHLKKSMTTQGGAKSTSEPVLKLLEPFHPLPGIILKFRHLQKVKSTYVDGLIPCVYGGRIRTSWEQTAAATGRITSRDPNLQAIPKQLVILDQGNVKLHSELNLRSVFISRHDHSILSADFQHIELRIFTHFAQDLALVKIFRDNRVDAFVQLAQQWLGHDTATAVTAEERDRTKRVVYAVMYGAGAKMLEEVLHVSLGEAKQILNSFTARFPQIKMFSQRTINSAREKGFLTSMSGRRRFFPNISSSNSQLKFQSERQAVNFLIQGSAADVCKAAMLITEKLQQTCTPPLVAHLLLQIHDELVWEVPDHQLSKFKELVRQAMEGLAARFNLSVPLPVEMSSGRTWAGLK